MKISIIHPTRGRKQRAFETATKWRDRAVNPENIEYIFSVDTDDIEWQLPEGMTMYWSGAYMLKGWNIITNPNKSAIEAINNATKVATGDLLIVVSDDFDCPDKWDMLLLDLLEGAKDFIVKTQDGIQKTLITLPIMDRKYYERFGYVYHPDYVHMHADEEMTIVGHMLGRVINLDILFPHNHYSVGKSEKDAINVKNDNSWAHGQRTLDRRAKDNFGIPNPLVRREDIVWK